METHHFVESFEKKKKGHTSTPSRGEFLLVFFSPSATRVFSLLELLELLAGRG